MDMSQYRELFISETREHLRTFDEMIVALEDTGFDKEKIDALFRIAHSIKGMAASMDFGEIAELAHRIEDLIYRIRQDEISFKTTTADLLLEGGNLLETMTTEIEAGTTTPHDFRDFFRRLSAHQNSGLEDDDGKVPAPQEELIVSDNIAADSHYDKADGSHSIRVRTDTLDNLINFTGELLTNKLRLMNIAREIGRASLDEALIEFSRLLRGLHNEVLKVRMVPFNSVTARLPKVVRELARKRGKDVTLGISGSEIEFDRGLLEELADPIIHIMRNAVDHGLESSSDRLASGKSSQGRITIKIGRA